MIIIAPLPLSMLLHCFCVNFIHNYLKEYFLTMPRFLRLFIMTAKIKISAYNEALLDYAALKKTLNDNEVLLQHVGFGPKQMMRKCFPKSLSKLIIIAY